MRLRQEKKSPPCKQPPGDPIGPGVSPESSSISPCERPTAPQVVVIGIARVTCIQSGAEGMAETGSHVMADMTGGFPKEEGTVGRAVHWVPV